MLRESLLGSSIGGSTQWADKLEGERKIKLEYCKHTQINQEKLNFDANIPGNYHFFLTVTFLTLHTSHIASASIFELAQSLS